MKKILFSMAMFALALVLLAGCRVKETDKDDAAGQNGSGAYRVVEIPEWNITKRDFYTDPSAPATATVTFDGKNYTGSYDCSIVRAPFSDTVSHVYQGAKDEKGRIMTFELDGATKELRGINLPADYPEVVITAEEAKTIADRFAKQYIPIDEYEVSATNSDGDHDWFYFTYRRMAGQYQTVDFLSVSVNGTGEIETMTAYAADSFTKEETDAIQINVDALHTVVDKEIEKRFVSETRPYEYTVDDRYLLTKTGDGHIVAEVGVVMKYQNEAGHEESESFPLYVALNETAS